MSIKRTIDKLPGGMMIIPLLIGAVIRTIDPGMFDSKTFSGSFTGGLMSGTLPLLGAFYICLGSTIDVHQAGYVVKKGATLWLTKVLVAAIFGLLIKALASNQNDIFLGLSSLAIVAAFADTNGGLYMALIGQLGKKEDAAAYSIISLESGPFFTMLILGVVGLASFPLLAFIYVLLPLLVGALLGNLDPDMRSFLGKGTDILIPMFALAIGASINLKDVVTAGTAGIVLGLGVIVISAVTLAMIDKLTGGNGVNGVAAATTAGNASVVPATVAGLYVGYRAIAAKATVQVAAAVIVTAILVPFLTGWYARRVSRRHPMSEPPASTEPTVADPPAETYDVPSAR